MTGELEYTTFVRTLNREGATIEDTIADLEAKEASLGIEPIYDGYMRPATRLGIFRGVCYDWLWVEPESLKQRRIDGELDSYFSSKVTA
jgi:hypothetical protein